MRRTNCFLFVAIIGLAMSALADAQPPTGIRADSTEAAWSQVIDGVTYYYDADGNPLYYDDPAYFPPRRFYYWNGGWVMDRSGRHHSRYAKTGLHKARTQAAQPGQARQTSRGGSVGRTLQPGQAAARDKSPQRGQKTPGTRTEPGPSAPVTTGVQTARRESGGQNGEIGQTQAANGQAVESGETANPGQNSASATGESTPQGGQQRPGAAARAGKSVGIAAGTVRRSGGQGGRRGLR